MSDLASEVRAIVDRETRAWDTQDAELLLSVFHPDMVWPWPKSPTSHDPMEWVLEWGRYDRQKWLSGWQELYDTHELVRNVRETKKVEVSEPASANTRPTNANDSAETAWRTEKSWCELCERTWRLRRSRTEFTLGILLVARLCPWGLRE